MSILLSKYSHTYVEGEEKQNKIKIGIFNFYVTNTIKADSIIDYHITICHREKERGVRYIDNY